MRIRSSDLIAGYPALKVRAVLRRSDTPSPGLVQEVLGLATPVDADAALRALERAGFLERKKDHGVDEYWRCTDLAGRLRNAKAVPPLHRRTADRLVQDLLGRVKQVNDDSQFAWRITEVVAFGSYVSPQKRIGDVDIGVRVWWKEADSDLQQRREEDVVARAREQGRQFRSFFDQLTWPEMAVLRALKRRSTGLSIHTLEPPTLSGPFRVLYMDDPWIGEHLPTSCGLNTPLVIGARFSYSELLAVTRDLSAASPGQDPWELLRRHLVAGGYDALVLTENRKLDQQVRIGSSPELVGVVPLKHTE